MVNTLNAHLKMSSEISQKMHKKMSNVEMQNLFRIDKKEKKKKNSFLQARKTGQEILN